MGQDKFLQSSSCHRTYTDRWEGPTEFELSGYPEIRWYLTIWRAWRVVSWRERREAKRRERDRKLDGIEDYEFYIISEKKDHSNLT